MMLWRVAKSMSHPRLETLVSDWIPLKNANQRDFATIHGRGYNKPLLAILVVGGPTTWPHRSKRNSLCCHLLKMFSYLLGIFLFWALKGMDFTAGHMLSVCPGGFPKVNSARPGLGRQGHMDELRVLLAVLSV